MSTEEDFQKKYVEYNIYKSQMEGLTQELSAVVNTENTLIVSKDTLKHIGSSKKKPEILAPIGGNAFLKADVKSADKVLIGIGANIVMEKDVDSAIETMDKQLEQLGKGRESIESKIKELDEHMAKLEPTLEKFAADLREKAGEKK